ncbi:sulfotransferase domain-containing protein [Pseudomonadota bacterium]
MITWRLHIINDILVASGNGKDARQIKHERNLDDLMKWHNNVIGGLTLIKLIKLWRISTQDGTFIVKSHAGPNVSVRVLSKLGLLRIVYCYRDPRDVLLSAVDHGNKILNDGENHTFANMVDFDIALKKVKAWLPVWKAYADMPEVLTIKYEEMMQDPVGVTKKIEGFLDISVDSGKREEILWKFSKDNSEGDRRGMHFNTARSFRYVTEMTKEQKVKCKSEFGSYLEAMEYDIE